MDVILKSQDVAQDYEVIGHGAMIDKPCQIGEWWVMPAHEYTGTIPDDIMKKWDDFKALNIPVLGYLIADDMRDVLIRREKEAEEKRERERAELERQRLSIKQAQDAAQKVRLEAEYQRRQEAVERDAGESAKVLAGVAAAAGMVVVGAAGIAALGAVALTAGLLMAALRFDPILIAVLPDGRWICLGAWWD